MKARGLSAQSFPIVEAFGYDVDSTHPTASEARERRWCPFANTHCEKFRQYRYGYCSITYAAADDERVPRTYAVCDHRLDGPPLNMVVMDFFKSPDNVKLIPEIVLTKPRESFDYVAIKTHGNEIMGAAAIETQAIDLRGGGVGPAWHAWSEGKREQWRDYFTREASKKNRKDTVAYGVNMANIYKRLGLQVVGKGTFLKSIDVPLYVVMQDRPFQYLRRRIPFAPIAEKTAWDITFITFEYTGSVSPMGQREFTYQQTVRTTLSNYVTALAGGGRSKSVERNDFLERVKRKAGLR